jgi:hypothetical protein
MSVRPKARLPVVWYQAIAVPVAIPDLARVRDFAAHLHTANQPWRGESFGWSAEYNPERPEAPLDSKMTFTPADFSIGESGVWFYSLLWERGRDQEAMEYLDDENVLAAVGG